MKAYVNYFDTDGARARAAIRSDDIRDNETVVQFNSSPGHWTMGLFEAERNCDILNSAHIHAKNWTNHWCQFEIEKVGKDDYAIVCKEHPDFASAAVNPA